MSRLFITVGLPGSGKTTRAEQWRAEKPLRRARVNRDDLRQQLFGGWTGLREHEDAVTAAQHAAVRALLVAGFDVVVDDTNLRQEKITELSNVGLEAGADVIGIWDLTNVTAEECVARDAIRAARGERHVGEQVIREMHARWLAAANDPEAPRT